MSSRYLAAYVASGASVEGRRLILATYSGLAPGAKSLRRVSRHDREVSPKRASVKSSMVRPSRSVYVPGARTGGARESCTRVFRFTCTTGGRLRTFSLGPCPTAVAPMITIVSLPVTNTILPNATRRPFLPRRDGLTGRLALVCV